MNMKKILFVDDEKGLADIAKLNLERKGYEVNVAYNGKEALAFLQIQRVDLVITDVIMPEMDGFTFYKEIKKSAEMSNTPVFIVSARPAMEDSFRTLGVDDFITKPIDVESLSFRIDQFFKGSSAAAVNKTVVVLDGDLFIGDQLTEQLRNSGFRAVLVEATSEFMASVLEEIPGTVYIDLLNKDAPADQIIKALRSFSKLNNLKIVVFTNVPVAAMQRQKDRDRVEQMSQACLVAGADEYLGAFNMVTFQELFN